VALAGAAYVAYPGVAQMEEGKTEVAVMSMDQWKVYHPYYGAIFLPAVNRLQALTQAAKMWGVRWTQIARECEIERMVANG